MSDKVKIVYEFYYIVGRNDFVNYYKLVIDRETEKMLYGEVFNKKGRSCCRCAINKSNLNKVHKFVDRTRGTVYRVQLEENDNANAHIKAKNIVYNYLLEIAENFMKYEEAN